jgi:hypothetical protein
MGWSWSVAVAQAAHEHLIDSTVRELHRSHRIGHTTDVVLSGDRVLHAIYIDDVNLFSHDKEAVQAAMDAYRRAAERAGLVLKTSKCIGPSADGVEVLGLRMNGREHTLGLSPDKTLRLISDTRRFTAGMPCTGRRLAALVGRWTWAALVNRPALSVFSAVYRYIDAARGRRFSLWESAARELARMAGLAPVLVSHLSRPTFRRAVAVDASSTGIGVVAGDAALLPHDMPKRPSGDGLTDIRAGLDVRRTLWSVIVSSRWKFEEHINALEMSAASTGLTWSLSHPDAWQSSLVLLTDSAVAAGILQKGRSSSPSLLVRARRIAALLLASGSTLDVRFVRSEYNPADGPSRQ